MLALLDGGTAHALTCACVLLSLSHEATADGRTTRHTEDRMLKTVLALSTSFTLASPIGLVWTLIVGAVTLSVFLTVARLTLSLALSGGKHA